MGGWMVRVVLDRAVSEEQAKILSQVGGFGGATVVDGPAGRTEVRLFLHADDVREATNDAIALVCTAGYVDGLDLPELAGVEVVARTDRPAVLSAFLNPGS